MKTIAIILAAGGSSRFGDDLPKQYHNLNGDVLLNKTIQAFAISSKVDLIQVVIYSKHMKLYESKIIPHSKLLPPCTGGNTRQQSAYLGLLALQDINPGKVLIHDAARPYIDMDIIDDVIDQLDRYKAVDVAMPVADTIKMKIGNEITSIDRDSLYATQTPQGFDYISILRAHQNCPHSNATDDITLMLNNGYEIGVVAGKPSNNKVTYQHDIPKGMRIGSGFDVHKFSEHEGAHFVMLGGIKIPHTHAIIAHSDGDVVLHALTDAMLGTIAAGDIGDHFPPTEERWRNVDSSVFLKHALDLLTQKGASIANVDITIICQKPKISGFRASIQSNISNILQLQPSQVSIKATTTEGLGFTGRKEGIAVQAVCLVNV